MTTRSLHRAARVAYVFVLLAASACRRSAREVGRETSEQYAARAIALARRPGYEADAIAAAIESVTPIPRSPSSLVLEAVAAAARASLVASSRDADGGAAIAPIVPVIDTGGIRFWRFNSTGEIVLVRGGSRLDYHDARTGALRRSFAQSRSVDDDYDLAGDGTNWRLVARETGEPLAPEPIAGIAMDAPRGLRYWLSADHRQLVEVASRESETDDVGTIHFMTIFDLARAMHSPSVPIGFAPGLVAFTSNGARVVLDGLRQHGPMERDEARTPRATAAVERAAMAALSDLVGATDNGRSTGAAGDTPRATPADASAVVVHDDPPLIQRSARSSDDARVEVHNAASGVIVASLGDGEGARMLRVSRDGRRYATVASPALPRGRTGDIVTLWNATEGTRVAALPLHAVIDEIAFSLDATRLATLDEAGAVRLWDAQTGEALGTTSLPANPSGLRRPRQGCPTGGAVTRFSALETLALRSAEEIPSAQLVFAPDDSRLLVRRWMGGWLLDARSLTVIRPLEGHLARIDEAPGIWRAITIADDGTLRVWDLLAAGAPESFALRLALGEVEVARLAGTTILVRFCDQRTQVWDLGTGMIARSLGNGGDLSTDGQWAFAPELGGVAVWDVRLATRVATLPDSDAINGLPRILAAGARVGFVRNHRLELHPANPQEFVAAGCRHLRARRIQPLPASCRAQ